MTARCSTCGTMPPDGARFCHRCGTMLPTAPSEGSAPARQQVLEAEATPPPGPPARLDRSALLARLLVALAIVVAAILMTRVLSPDPSDAPDSAAGSEVRLPAEAGAPTAADEEPTGRRGPDADEGATDADGGGTEDAEGPSVDPDEGPPPAGGLSCRNPRGEVACIDALAAIALDEDDQVVIAGSRIAVATSRGRVSIHELGTGRRRWSTQLPPPVRLYPHVAGTIPIGHQERIRFLTLEEGVEVGSFDVEVRDAVSATPWFVVRDAEDSIAARSVTGNATWVQSVPDGGDSWLTPRGTYVADAQGTLSSLFSNTGGRRWSTPLPGVVTTVERLSERTVVVLDDPASIATLDARGEILTSADLPGSVRWSGVDPDGSHAVVVTDQAEGGSILTIVDIATGAPSSSLPLPGAPSAEPAIGRSVVAVPILEGNRPEVLLIGLNDRVVRATLPSDGPVRSVALLADTAIAILDDRGLLVVRALATNAEHYRIAFGPEARLLRDRPLLVRSSVGVVALDPEAGALVLP